MSLDLSTLTVEDLDAVTALEGRSQPLPWSEDQLLLELVHDDARITGAFAVGDASRGRALVGYVAMRRMVDEMWILNIAVDPGWRRRGVARRLMDAAFAFAVERSCGSLWLEVRAGNEGARALYAAVGLEARALRRAYYPPIPPATQREDALVLSRVLKASHEL